MARALDGVRRTPAAGGPALTAAPARGTIDQGGGRRKAYRPLSAGARRDAFEAGLAAYARGDFFEAHELLEPAWMGTADLAERALYQGLIKLAAAYVHQVRGNPLGVIRNLEGARTHLADSLARNAGVAAGSGLDLELLLAEIADRLAALRALPSRVVPVADSGSPSPRRPVAGVPPAPPLRRP